MQKLLFNLFLNYEEGGENCLYMATLNQKDFYLKLSMLYHGQISAIGIWRVFMNMAQEAVLRIFDLFTEYDIPITVYGIATALARSPEQVYAMQSANWEIASHGYKWIEHKDLTQHEEEEQIKKAIDLHTAVTGNPQKDGILEERP